MHLTSKSVAKAFIDRVILTTNRVFNANVTATLDNCRSVSDDGYYPDFCMRAALNSRQFNHFKRSAIYRRILEHVTQEQGLRYLKVIQRDNPDFLNTSILTDIRGNDTIGGAELFEYPHAGRVSPSTMRYLKVCSDLKLLFGSLEGFSIAEIGGGYGGQCVLIDKIWETKHYTILDLDQVLMLISRYLENFLLRTCFEPVTLNRFTNDEHITLDLVISNYAFSELPRPLQNKHLKRVIMKAKRGYLTMNSGKEHSINGEITAAELSALIPSCRMLQEEPNTSPDNYIVAWGPKA